MRKAAGLAVAFVPVCSLTLSACGGGGGDEDEYSAFAFRAADVNGSSAIMVTGGSPPDVSSSQAMSQKTEVFRRRNRGHGVRIEVDSENVSVSLPWSYDTESDPIATLFFESDVVDPIMTKNGIRLARVSSKFGLRGDLDYTNIEYGGWMDHSVFWVEVRTGTQIGGSSVFAVEGWGFAWGDAPNTNPSTGPFVWNGVMVGRNSDIESSDVSNVVQGDAAVSAELSQAGDMSVDVAFSNIKDLNSGNLVADITWTDLSVVDGSFEDGTIAGSFFGPQHEEVVGTFKKNDILGAFGARR